MSHSIYYHQRFSFFFMNILYFKDPSHGIHNLFRLEDFIHKLCLKWLYTWFQIHQHFIQFRLQSSWLCHSCYFSKRNKDILHHWQLPPSSSCQDILIQPTSGCTVHVHPASPLTFLNACLYPKVKWLGKDFFLEAAQSYQGDKKGTLAS